jgi:hypothetical protein
MACRGCILWQQQKVRCLSWGMDLSCHPPLGVGTSRSPPAWRRLFRESTTVITMAHSHSRLWLPTLLPRLLRKNPQQQVPRVVNQPAAPNLPTTQNLPVLNLHNQLAGPQLPTPLIRTYQIPTNQFPTPQLPSPQLSPPQLSPTQLPTSKSPPLHLSHPQNPILDHYHHAAP